MRISLQCFKLKRGFRVQRSTETSNAGLSNPVFHVSLKNSASYVSLRNPVSHFKCKS